MVMVMVKVKVKVKVMVKVKVRVMVMNYKLEDNDWSNYQCAAHDLKAATTLYEEELATKKLNEVEEEIVKKFRDALAESVGVGEL